MIATVVETKELVQTVVAATVAGVGITLFFSLMILGVTRFADLRRDNRPIAAAAAAGVATVALLATGAGIAFGIIVMLSK